MADNVDHNIDTLDGNGIFHVIGIVAAVTPSNAVPLKIRQLAATSDDLKLVGKINVNFYSSPSYQISEMKFESISNISYADNSKKLDTHIKILWPLKAPTPGWSGVWQMAYRGEYPGKTSVIFLPIIDLNPSDLSCIYSTMQYVLDRICQDDKIDTICSESAENVTRCFAYGRIATLWGQYLEMVDILKCSHF